MKSSPSPTILVLGAQGMLGRMVFNYLSSQYPKTTWGTIRKKEKKQFLLTYDAHSLKQLENIYKNLEGIDYLINCIGILQSNKNTKEMIYINEKFPNKQARFAEKNNIKIIHVSTDAVFSPDKNRVTENTPVSPSDLYGQTKLAGESVSKNVITLRTSLLGFDPYNHKGLLEWVLQTTQKPLGGYTNQLWSGCTTLQFAKLCELVIKNDAFEEVRNVSSVFHFAPLVKITKHDIIKTLLLLMQDKRNIVKQTSDPISRQLHTHYPDLLFLKHQEKNLKKALKELLIFEEEYIKKYDSQ